VKVFVFKNHFQLLLIKYIRTLFIEKCPYRLLRLIHYGVTLLTFFSFEAWVEVGVEVGQLPA
jgi:hypothetical protein